MTENDIKCCSPFICPRPFKEALVICTVTAADLRLNKYSCITCIGKEISVIYVGLFQYYVLMQLFIRDTNSDYKIISYICY